MEDTTILHSFWRDIDMAAWRQWCRRNPEAMLLVNPADQAFVQFFVVLAHDVLQNLRSGQLAKRKGIVFAFGRQLLGRRKLENTGG